MTAAQQSPPQPLDVRPIAGAIGAEIHGADLSKPLSDDAFAEIHRAFLDHLVIFLPGQASLDPDRLKNFADGFGEVDMAPFAYP